MASEMVTGTYRGGRKHRTDEAVIAGYRRGGVVADAETRRMVADYHRRAAEADPETHRMVGDLLAEQFDRIMSTARAHRRAAANRAKNSSVANTDHGRHLPPLPTPAELDDQLYNSIFRQETTNAR